MAYRVRLLKQNTEVYVNGGSLAEACRKAGYPLRQPCGANGRCGKCMVSVVVNHRTVQMLACKMPVRQNMDIIVEDVQLEQIEASEADSAYLTDAVVEEKLNPLYQMQEEVLGAAIDIGTTSVVAYVYNLNTGERIGVASALNRQAVHGADVIARIQYASEARHCEELRREILDTINGLLQECVGQCSDAIRHLVLAGNSTMQHLFFGWNPEALGRSPYRNITLDMVQISGKESGLLCHEEARVEFLPLLGGFVGADTLACLLALPEENWRTGKISLLMDLGTNAELALIKDGSAHVCSTACGPALEGGHISCGMRAEKGAVDSIRFENHQLRYHVIGEEKKACGLCGSAIIDLIAGLLEEGIINHRGNLQTGPNVSEITPDQLAFWIDRECDLYFSQNDIRQIQLAKSAILTSAEILMGECGVKSVDIDQIYLAGAFGNYICVPNAVKSGIIPQVATEKIQTIGNGAGCGLQKLLLNKENYAKIKKIKNCTRHLVLTDYEGFENKYVKNLDFSAK